MPAVYLSTTVQDTTPEGVLSRCGYSLTLTLTSSQGYMVGCGCHERSDQPGSSQGYVAWCGCHEILIPCCLSVLLSIPLLLSNFYSLVPMNSVCFSSISVQPLTVLVNYWFKIEELSTKMAISSSAFQRQIILSKNTDRIRASVLKTWSHSFLFSLLISSSLFLSLTCAVPKFHLAPLRPPSHFFIHFLSLPVLSKKQLQEAFSLHAGVTKGVTSHAAHEGIWHDAGVTRSWLHAATFKKSLILINIRLEPTKILHLDDKRNAQRWQSNTNWRHKNIRP